MEKVRIAIADDHQLFIEGFSQLLSRKDDWNVILKANDGEELLTGLRNGVVVDLIFLDLDMPVLDGVETLKIIRKEFPEVKIAILSMHQEESIVLRMIELGAHAYVLKNAPFGQVELAIKQLISIGYYYDNSVIEIMRKGLIYKMRKKPVIGNNIRLSEREVTVLLYICKGLRAAEISEKLYISPRTVEGHKKNLLEKTDTRNTAELMVYCLKNKLISLEQINLST